MVRFFALMTVIITIWFWIIITWIHVIIQSLSLGGYVYQPYKKYPSLVRDFFVYCLYPFCCKPITDKYEIKLVPVKEAYKRLLVMTLLWSFVTFVGYSVEWERYRSNIQKKNIISK